MVSPYLGGKTLGLAKLRRPFYVAGTRVEATIEGGYVAGEVVRHPVYDPESRRPKSSPDVASCRRRRLEPRRATPSIGALRPAARPERPAPECQQLGAMDDAGRPSGRRTIPPRARRTVPGQRCPVPGSDEGEQRREIAAFVDDR